MASVIPPAAAAPEATPDTSLFASPSITPSLIPVDAALAAPAVPKTAGIAASDIPPVGIAATPAPMATAASNAAPQPSAES